MTDSAFTAQGPVSFVSPQVTANWCVIPKFKHSETLPGQNSFGKELKSDRFSTLKGSFKKMAA